MHPVISSSGELDRCFGQVSIFLNCFNKRRGFGTGLTVRSQAREKGGIMVAVGAVVVDGENRVLLVQHVEAKQGGFWYGKWICPGGKLRLGESLVEGMVREVKEETNLDVAVSRGPLVFDRVVK